LTNNERILTSKIERAKTIISVRLPFLSYILQHYPIYFDQTSRTAGTNGSIIIFGEDFLGKLTVNETVFILLHELLHIVLEHPFRKHERNLHRFNVACDIVINDILKSDGIDEGGLEPIFGAAFNIDGTNNIAEHIYQILPNDIKKDHYDFHDMWVYANENDRQKIRNIVKEAYDKGYEPPRHSTYFRHVDENGKPSKTNWTSLLKPYIKPHLFDYTFERIDHRFSDILLPEFNRYEETLPTIWFLIDVSGSMSSTQLETGLKELTNLIKQFRHVKGLISFFSNVVTKPKKFQSVFDLRQACNKIESTGGTSFSIIFEAYQTMFKSNRPKVVVIMTDGFAAFPPKEDVPSIPLIWAINNHVVDVPYGKVVRI